MDTKEKQYKVSLEVKYDDRRDVYTIIWRDYSRDISYSVEIQSQFGKKKILRPLLVTEEPVQMSAIPLIEDKQWDKVYGSRENVYLQIDTKEVMQKLCEKIFERMSPTENFKSILFEEIGKIEKELFEKIGRAYDPDFNERMR